MYRVVALSQSGFVAVERPKPAFGAPRSLGPSPSPRRRHRPSAPSSRAERCRLRRFRRPGGPGRREACGKAAPTTGRFWPLTGHRRDLRVEDCCGRRDQFVINGFGHLMTLPFRISREGPAWGFADWAPEKASTRGDVRDRKEKQVPAWAWADGNRHDLGEKVGVLVLGLLRQLLGGQLTGRGGYERLQHDEPLRPQFEQAQLGTRQLYGPAASLRHPNTRLSERSAPLSTAS